MKRRIVSLLMCLVMVLSLLPTAVWAEVLPEQQDAAQQTTAENGGQEDSKPSDSDEEPAANTAAPQSGESGAAAQAAGDVAEVNVYGKVTTYADIFEAFAAITGTGTVKLLQDVTLDNANGNGIELRMGQTVTLDLNGKTISQKSGISTNMMSLSSAVFSVSHGADLTVMDSVGGGKIVQPNGCPAVAVWKNVLEGTLTVNGGTIENTSTEVSTDITQGTPNCAVYAYEGTVTINGGTVTGQKIGVGAYKATLTITDGQLHGESSNALLVGNSSVSLSGGTYTTKEKDNHSIWCTSSGVKDLLKAGYGYVAENGGTVQIDGNGKCGGTVGKTLVAKVAEVVPYIDANGTVQSCAQYTEITDTDNFQIGSGWYVVRDDATISNIMTAVGSPIHLILCDGATLTMSAPIEAAGAEGEKLVNIYLQSGGTGKLIANSGVLSGAAVTFKPISAPMKMLGWDNNPTSVLSDYFNLSKCTDHQWEYKNITDDTHDKLCALCGTGETSVAHTAKSYEQSDDANLHIVVCECGKEHTEDHTTISRIPQITTARPTPRNVSGAEKWELRPSTTSATRRRPWIRLRQKTIHTIGACRAV